MRSALYQSVFDFTASHRAYSYDGVLQDTQGKPIDDDDTNALRFRVGSGPNNVRLEDLILVSLHHVSQGSWQPHLRLRRHIP